jgi:hypothetical protein
MKIAIAGGLGFEKGLLDALHYHNMLLVGSCYDLKKEKFPLYGNAECIGEYITSGYSSYFASYDLYIDVSDSLKSKFVINDFSRKYGKKYIALFYDNAWKIGVFYPEKPCLECFMDYARPRPNFLIPAADSNLVVESIKEEIDNKEGESYLKELGGANSNIIKREISPGCLASSGKLRFLGGELDDVVSVSCSDQSVAVTPMEEFRLDLDYFREILKKETRIVGQNTFYIEFKVFHLNALLFRHGRLIVKGTKEKNTALALYRRYVGN